MARISWADTGQRFYETGVDRCVLYLKDRDGIPWYGITAITENTTGGDTKSYYQDGVKTLEVSSPEEFEATLSALTYPDEFTGCDGTFQARPGLYVTQQARKPFGLSYRTLVGAMDSTTVNYKIHIVYNALASPADREYSSISDSTNPITLQWNLSTTPVATAGYAPSAHIVIDTRSAAAQVVETIENILYGTDVDAARLPTLEEIVAIFDVPDLVVTDHGDGTYTLLAPDYAFSILTADEFEITWPTAVMIDADSYTISS
jgi:hypothetical protein